MYECLCRCRCRCLCIRRRWYIGTYLSIVHRAPFYYACACMRVSHQTKRYSLDNIDFIVRKRKRQTKEDNDDEEGEKSAANTSNRSHWTNSLNGEWKKAKYVLRRNVKDETKATAKVWARVRERKTRKRKGGDDRAPGQSIRSHTCVCVCGGSSQQKMGERCKRESTTKNSWFCWSEQVKWDSAVPLLNTRW